MITRLLLLAYIALVAFIVLTPEPVDRALRAETLTFAAFVRGAGLVWLQYWHVEFTANVLLFVPLGLLLTLQMRRSRHARWLPPILSILATVAVELVQLALLPERLASVYDVVANSLGAILGWCIALPFVRVPVSTTESLDELSVEEIDEAMTLPELAEVESAGPLR